jgi:hypothetical protein
MLVPVIPALPLRQAAAATGLVAADAVGCEVDVAMKLSLRLSHSNSPSR